MLSAGHCLLGSDTQQVAFVPQYTRAKPQPYGMFPVLRDAGGHSKIWIDPRYRSQGVDRAATLDVAFAQVGPNSRGFPVEAVVGGNRLVTGAAYAQARVTLIGHPASAARPRVCVNRTTKFTSADARIPGSFLRINCTGYPGGTSGGPFLTRYDARTGTGDVVGVIGGWKTGGDKADTSYSSYFGADIRKLYEKAVAGAKAGRQPAPHPPGAARVADRTRGRRSPSPLSPSAGVRPSRRRRSARAAWTGARTTSAPGSTEARAWAVVSMASAASSAAVRLHPPGAPLPQGAMVS